MLRRCPQMRQFRLDPANVARHPGVRQLRGFGWRFLVDAQESAFPLTVMADVVGRLYGHLEDSHAHRFTSWLDFVRPRVPLRAFGPVACWPTPMTSRVRAGFGSRTVEFIGQRAPAARRVAGSQMTRWRRANRRLKLSKVMRLDSWSRKDTHRAAIRNAMHLVVEPMGIEPTTSSMPWKRSPN